MTGDSASETLKPLQTSKRNEWFFALALLAVTLAAYYPAWFGKPVWDDDAHITSPELRSFKGLARIWMEPGATQQYYPLVHSAFWLQYKIWGDSTAGYHLVNILLHVCCALLLLRILRFLEMPGAWLAAAIFALHPVEVESVAWITELKNTLSGAFYLGAALAYLRFDRSRNWRLYFTSFALFFLGLFCKTVIATLPAALLVVFWWKRGKLSWKEDIKPLIPFFVLGIGMGLVTVYVEKKYIIGNAGAAFNFTLVERCLIAGRAFWFYTGKLLWPSDLIFIYPRWNVSQSVWWQYLFPAAALVLLAVLWMLRKRTRAPLAAMLFFGGTLFPALGFVNVYPFVYSFVADHFQYLAGIGIITLVSAGTVLLSERLDGWMKHAGKLLCVAVLLLMAGLTWGQCRGYADSETLYTKTIEQNPECWMAYNNLGTNFQDRGELDKAISCFQKALEIKPDYASAISNLGYTLHQMGRLEEAIILYQQALNITPGILKTQLNLAIAFRQVGRMQDALAHFEMALKIDPGSAAANNDLGYFLLEQGELDGAIGLLEKAVKIDPGYAEAHNNLGFALLQKGETDQAIGEFQKALKIKPGYAQARDNLNLAYKQKGTTQ